MSRVFGTSWEWMFLALLFPSAMAAVTDERNYATGGGSGHWTPREWTRTGHYSDIRNYADRPDEQTLSKLSVEWQKPELDGLGNLCTIRGQVIVTEGDNGQKRTKPMDWFQG